MKRSIFFCGIALLLILLCVCCYKEVTPVDAAERGYLYSASNDSYEEQTVLIRGEGRKSLFSHVFTGEIVVGDDILQTAGKTFQLKFHGDTAEVLLLNSAGYIYPSRLHSGVLNKARDGMVVVLYSEYRESDNSVTALLDSENLSLLCIGNMSKDEALSLLTAK